MNRPKAASSSASFLDDLLGNEIENAILTSSTSSPATSATSQQQRQRKSVRFFDDDDDQPDLSSLRPRSSTLESLLNTSDGKNQDKSKVDWLGISSSEEEAVPTATSNLSTRQTSSAFASIVPRGGASNVGINGARPGRTTATANNSSDWLSAGLKARQAQATTSTLQPQPKETTTSSADPRSWQPKILSQTESQKIPNVVSTVSPSLTTTLEQPTAAKTTSWAEKEIPIELASKSIIK